MWLFPLNASLLWRFYHIRTEFRNQFLRLTLFAVLVACMTLMTDGKSQAGVIMNAYAVIETGGKQYRVGVADTLKVERLPEEVGARVSIKPVLALSDGAELKIGAPGVEDAEVTATVVEHIRGKKVVAFRKKRRKGYNRKVGHRQELTVLKIEGIA